MTKHNVSIEAVDRKVDEAGPIVEKIAREVWQLAELSHEEVESARLLMDVLEKSGFVVTSRVAVRVHSLFCTVRYRPATLPRTSIRPGASWSRSRMSQRSILMSRGSTVAVIRGDPCRTLRRPSTNLVYGTWVDGSRSAITRGPPVPLPSSVGLVTRAVTV